METRTTAKTERQGVPRWILETLNKLNKQLNFKAKKKRQTTDVLIMIHELG